MGHFQVRQDETRVGVLFTIGIPAFSLHVGDCLVAGAHELNGAINPEFPKSPFHEHPFVGVALDDQDGRVIFLHELNSLDPPTHTNRLLIRLHCALTSLKQPVDAPCGLRPGDGLGFREGSSPGQVWLRRLSGAGSIGE